MQLGVMLCQSKEHIHRCQHHCAVGVSEALLQEVLCAIASVDQTRGGGVDIGLVNASTYHDVIHLSLRSRHVSSHQRQHSALTPLVELVQSIQQVTDDAGVDSHLALRVADTQ